MKDKRAGTRLSNAKAPDDAGAASSRSEQLPQAFRRPDLIIPLSWPAVREFLVALGYISLPRKLIKRLQVLAGVFP